MNKKTVAIGLCLGVTAAALLLSSEGEQGPKADRSASARSQVTLRSLSPSVVDEAARPADDGVYRLTELMVAPSSAEALDSLAAELDLEVLSRTEDGRMARIAVPSSMTRQQLADQLNSDPRVRSAVPNAIMGGAKKQAAPATTTTSRPPPPPPSSLVSAQWHLKTVGMPTTVTDFGQITVAVLDSGVAYQSAVIDGRTYAVPGSLQGVRFVSPKDFVDDDELPLDEHQHGTHVASLIASQGHVSGVAAGVGIMPVRVLDAQNQGTEYDLIQGIRWAVENGAQVINMSLAFQPGYVPSVALREALEDATLAGVVLVGAAGNDGRDDMPCWPAASPLVISVGATVGPDGKYDRVPDYSNIGVGIDIMAPGGDLAKDRDGDGHVDGMIAETISLNDPSTVGPWLFAGTSQAAAMVSGGVAHLLASGVSPFEVRRVLLEKSSYWGSGSFAKGYGAGSLNIAAAQSATLAELPPERRYGASLLTWISSEEGLDGSASAKAMAIVTVVDAAGLPVQSGDTEVFGTVWGPAGAMPWVCKPELNTGTCEIKGDSVPVGADGSLPAAAWGFSVEAVVDKHWGVPYRPSTVLFASDALELILAGMDVDPSLRRLPLAVEWQEGEDPVLGTIAAGWSVGNAGTGLATSPLGLVFTPAAVSFTSVTDVAVDLDGTGLATSPMGLFPMQRIQVDGTGLATSPMGFSQLTMASFSGTGLATSPMGFSAFDLLSAGGSAPSLGMGLNGGIIFMEDGSITGIEPGAEPTHIDEMTAMGGLVSPEGYEAASLLAGSGAAEIGLTATGDAIATGESSIPLR